MIVKACGGAGQHCRRFLNQQQQQQTATPPFVRAIAVAAKWDRRRRHCAAA